jgi:hypothetical protein
LVAGKDAMSRKPERTVYLRRNGGEWEWFENRRHTTPGARFYNRKHDAKRGAQRALKTTRIVFVEVGA